MSTLERPHVLALPRLYSCFPRRTESESRRRKLQTLGVLSNVSKSSLNRCPLNRRLTTSRLLTINVRLTNGPLDGTTRPPRCRLSPRRTPPAPQPGATTETPTRHSSLRQVCTTCMSVPSSLVSTEVPPCHRSGRAPPQKPTFPLLPRVVPTVPLSKTNLPRGTSHTSCLPSWDLGEMGADGGPWVRPRPADTWTDRESSPFPLDESHLPSGPRTRDCRPSVGPLPKPNSQRPPIEVGGTRLECRPRSVTLRVVE